MYAILHNDFIWFQMVPFHGWYGWIYDIFLRMGKKPLKTAIKVYPVAESKVVEDPPPEVEDEEMPGLEDVAQVEDEGMPPLEPVVPKQKRTHG